MSIYLHVCCVTEIDNYKTKSNNYALIIHENSTRMKWSAVLWKLYVKKVFEIPEIITMPLCEVKS